MLNKVIDMIKEKYNNYPKINQATLQPVNFISSSKKYKNIRLNLVLPKANIKYIYGGISTALLFFNEFAKYGNFKKRIIITDEEISTEICRQYSKYNIINSESDDDLDSVITDLYWKTRDKKKLRVRHNDVFIMTFWKTDFIFSGVSDFIKKNFKYYHYNIYFIQDYEPGFYPWSSDYMLADSTYLSGNKVAVFNSKNLYNYFSKMGYNFIKEFYFEPVINQSLYQILNKSPNEIKKKNIIVIYGRPYTERNCFSIIVQVLKCLAAANQIAPFWKIVSVGSSHRNIKLENGMMIKSLGKLNLEDYAELLLTSKVGISLMCSPHPSYPPLEMAAFGLKTVTNNFRCKDMCKFSSNIITLDYVNYETLSRGVLLALQECHNSCKLQVTTEYLEIDNQFLDIFTSLKSLISIENTGCDYGSDN